MLNEQELFFLVIGLGLNFTYELEVCCNGINIYCCAGAQIYLYDKPLIFIGDIYANICVKLNYPGIDISLHSSPLSHGISAQHFNFIVFKIS